MPTKKKIWIGELLIGAVVMMVVVGNRPSADDVDPVALASSASAPVERFATNALGATPSGEVLLEDGRRVALLGVVLPGADDHPAVVRASRQTLATVVRGRPVEVEYDPVFSRSLQEGSSTVVAYIWLLGADGSREGMLNALLISRGLARATPSLVYRQRTRFLEAQALAQRRQEGVWMGL